MSVKPKPRPIWSDPVWVQDTTYRFVNVGEAPAFDVVITSMGDGSRFADMPSFEVPETHIPVVAPGRFVDVEVQITSRGVPERPRSLDPRAAGWPPISGTLTLAWNDVRKWKPRSGDQDPFGAKKYFGFERQYYETLSLPPNQLPKDYRWSVDRSVSAAKGDARIKLVQYERVLNIWLTTSEELLQTVEGWETDLERGRSLFSRDPVVSVRANGQMRHDLDRLALAAFVSLTMLDEHASQMLTYCDAASRHRVTSMKDALKKQFPFARHADTVRNYLSHQGLLNWICRHNYGTNTLSIEVDVTPILRWARTRDRNRTAVENVMFTEFLTQYGGRGRADSIPLRTWVQEMLDANREPMLTLYRDATAAIARMP